MTKTRINGIRAWLLAFRPKTLTGAVAPVGVALCAAYTKGCFLLAPAVLCLLFAVLMQIDANLINDYFDFKNGRDGADRLGPERACSQGLITPRAMQKGIVITTILACLVGLPLVFWGGPIMIAVGMMCLVFCFLYTTCLSQIGLGDVLVLVFFGLIPVCITYFLQTQTLSTSVVLYALSVGAVTDNLLIVNNYRDLEQDASNGKRTLVVMLGAKSSEYLYLTLGILAYLFCLYAFIQEGNQTGAFVLLIYLPFHFYNYHHLKKINHGRELNRVLGTTALSILFFALLLSTAIFL